MQTTTMAVVWYALASLIALFGVLRVVRLGLRPSRAERAETDPAMLARWRRARRQHVIWGLVYVVMGAVLALSTAGVIRLRLGLF